MRGPVLAIVGPTAAGKSKLAELVASKLSCPVISCDSMQVYRGMDIGTAKLPVSERSCKLEMVDIVDVSCDYSVQLFQKQARTCVDASLDSSGFALLCGGTGLYLDAVVDDMHFPKGNRASSTRAFYEDFLADHDAQALWEMLSSKDPESAQLIHPNNAKRVVRALEMLDEGSSYADSAGGLHEHKPYYRSKIWALNMDREQLYQRIDTRVDEMFADGLLDEVQTLKEQGLSSNKTAGQAIGYKEVLSYLEGACSLEEAISEVKSRSRHYAKRQLSWFRRDERIAWIELDPSGLEESLERAAEAILSQAQVELESYKSQGEAYG